jgi:hypothetical protein
MLNTKTSAPPMFAMTPFALAIGSEQTAPLTAYWLLKAASLDASGAKLSGNVVVPAVLQNNNK